jgi:hypothetical protein
MQRAPPASRPADNRYVRIAGSSYLERMRGISDAADLCAHADSELSSESRRHLSLIATLLTLICCVTCTVQALSLVVYSLAMAAAAPLSRIGLIGLAVMGE